MGGIYSSKQVNIFLKNMFYDKNILTAKSNLLRKFIANMIILFRKREANDIYNQISFKTPILKITNILAKKLENKLGIKVLIAMRYTPPFSSKTIRILKKENIKDILLLPLYPQYSTTTTKSSIEDFEDTAKENNLDLNITKIERFYKLNSFLELICKEIIKTKDKLKNEETYLIFSAHSLPEKIIKKGDTYQKELEHQVELISNKLKEKEIYFKKIILAYQSKATPVKWIGPSLEHILHNIYPTNNQKNVIIYPISFIIDNAETVIELSIEYKKVANKLSFDNYRVCECPNDSDDFIKCLEEIIQIS
jgi:ferrochelatase